MVPVTVTTDRRPAHYSLHNSAPIQSSVVAYRTATPPMGKKFLVALAMEGKFISERDTGSAMSNCGCSRHYKRTLRTDRRETPQSHSPVSVDSTIRDVVSERR